MIFKYFNGPIDTDLRNHLHFICFTYVKLPKVHAARLNHALQNCRAAFGVAHVFIAQSTCWLFCVEIAKMPSLQTEGTVSSFRADMM